MKYDSWASLLAHSFASPCFGCEPKVRVATKVVAKHTTVLLQTNKEDGEKSNPRLVWTQPWI
jgi:hypothetical protein